MSETDARPPIATALTGRSRRISIIWSIPLLAIALGAWLAWDTYAKRGPTIAVTFDSAEGLEAGQSPLKFKDIELGKVQSLELTPDHSRVGVKIATTRQAEPLLTDKTAFWVARPRLFAGSISGLGTLISGSYVAMLPGPTGGRVRRRFLGQEEPPILSASLPGRTFLLKGQRLGSISLGSPVFFRDLDVGEVLGWKTSDMARSVTIRAFVRAPYDKYIHTETRFWNASGISVKLGSNGIQLQLESLRALLLGGVAFDTPAAFPSPLAKADQVFPLYTDRDAADAASYQRKISFVSYFTGSVRGLGPGSEVTVHGLVVGDVTGVRLTYDPVKDIVLAPVRYEVEPERVLGVGKKAFDNPAEGVAALLQHGLRASLQSDSLITGQQVVALDFATNAAPAKLKMEGSDFVMPVIAGGGVASLEASAADLLQKVNEIPFEKIGDELGGILTATDNVVNGAQARQAVTNLAVTLDQAKALVSSLNSGADPALRHLPRIASSLQRTLSGTDKLIGSLNNGYGDNTLFNQSLDRLLIQLNSAVSSIRALADLLARHPEALIKGRGGEVHE